MNHQTHYLALIAKARSRTLDGYSERHHIVPRCLGGDNSPSNIVRLTAQEHYVAHLLLAKMTPDEPKLLHAAWTMVRKSLFVHGRRGGKAYAWLRAKYAEMMREKMLGHKPSEATRAKRSASAKQNVVPPLQRKRMVESSAATRSSPEFRASISKSMKEKWRDPDFRAAKLSSLMHRSSPRRTAAMVKRWESPEYRERMKAKLAGVNSGRKASAETKAKMSAAGKGKSIPPEQREKMRLSALAWRKAKREAAAV